MVYLVTQLTELSLGHGEASTHISSSNLHGDGASLYFDPKGTTGHRDTILIIRLHSL